MARRRAATPQGEAHREAQAVTPDDFTAWARAIAPVVGLTWVLVMTTVALYLMRKDLR